MHNKILGRKHNESEEKFLHVWENITKYVSREHILRRQEQAVSWIRRATEGKRTAFMYSGGKDSGVIQHIALLAGVENGMMALTQELEFPVFDCWACAQVGSKVEVYRTPFTYEWLGENPQWLFIKDMSQLRPWTIWKPQNKYIQKHNVEAALYGRRTIDGNFCGKGGLYEKKGVIQMNPIFDWSHEEVFGYLHYMNIEISPTYHFPRPEALREGWFYHGTTPWFKVEVKPSIPERLRTMKSWEVLYELDASIVIRAAEHIDSARKFMEGCET